MFVHNNKTNYNDILIEINNLKDIVKYQTRLIQDLITNNNILTEKITNLEEKSTINSKLQTINIEKINELSNNNVSELLLTNINSSDNENDIDNIDYSVTNNLIKLFEEKLEVIVNKSDIVNIFKIKNLNKTDENIITDKYIIKFNNSTIRYDLLKNRKKIKNSDIYLNENLSKENSNIFYNTRTLYRNTKIAGTCTFNGSVYIQIKKNSENIKINSIYHLNSLEIA